MNAKSEKPFSFELIMDVHHAGEGVQQYLDLSSELEVLLEEKEADLQDDIQERLAGMPEDVQSDLIHFYAEDLHQYQLLFPSLHRESMFISLYNYLEYTLNRVCKGIGDEIGTRVRLTDIKGKGIERALLFLKLVPGFELPGAREAIAFIRQANGLRNIVVHNGGRLPDDKNHALNGFVRSQQALSASRGHMVHFRGQFLSLFGAQVRALFEEIGNDMQRYMGNRV